MQAPKELTLSVLKTLVEVFRRWRPTRRQEVLNAPRRIPESMLQHDWRCLQIPWINRRGSLRGRGCRSEGEARDSGKHAFSVIEGAGKSRAIKGEGFGERGRARLREVGIYRRGWCPFSSIFQVFLGSFSSCSFCRFFFVFCALSELKMERNLVKNKFF